MQDQRTTFVLTVAFCLALSLCFQSAQSVDRRGVAHPSDPLQITGDNCSCGVGMACCGNDSCCSSNTESCCPDEISGPICCITEMTYCCAPDAIFPSRCCPRWFVCCLGGRYGCCDPSTGKPMEEVAGSSVAYGLYQDGEGNFNSLIMDFTTGDWDYKPVSGYNDWGEITRVFAYDATHTLFYLLQANFTEKPNHDITLYTADPTTGALKSAIVSGATDPDEVDVTGFAFVAGTQNLLMSIQVMKGDTVTGYNFYTVNPNTAVATLISNCNTSVDFYCGWFDQITSDGTIAYRLGYKNVISQTEFGLGVTDISNPIASTKWLSNVPIPNGLSDYMSLNLFKDSFISLAPDYLGNLNVVKWSLNGSASILMTPDDSYNTPYFGPILEYINQEQTTYLAMVVYISDISSDFDRWALLVVDLQSGQSSEVTLYPWILSEITSMSALGME